VESELKATFSRASSDLSSFKKSLNFRLNLAKSREQLLINDHFKKFDASQIDIPEEVKQFKELLGLKDKEIESLR